MEEKSLQQKEDELLSASMMGDIREDVEFLGLSFMDVVWIILSTLLIGSLAYGFPFPFWFKIGWLISVFIVSCISRIGKWPYKLYRFYLYQQQKKLGNGEKIGKVLGISEDGWLYRSGNQMHVITSVIVPPWSTAVYSEKRSRIGTFETFLRNLVQEGFEATISSEQVPDFRHQLWTAKKEKMALTEGIQRMKLRRIAMWEKLAMNGEAKRSEYTLTLSTTENRVEIREREDEPEEVTKEELRRFRLMTEMREKKNRVLNALEGSGHTPTLLSGFSTLELIGRWWDRTTWHNWKAVEGTWEEENVLVLEAKVEDQEVFEEMEPKVDLIPADDHWSDEEELINLEGDPVTEALSVISKDTTTSGKKGRLKWNFIPQVYQVIKANIQGKRSSNRAKEGRLFWGLHRMYQRRRVEVKAVDKPDPPIQEEAKEIEFLPNGLYILTSPAPSGKTFMTANLAAAIGVKQGCSLIDLSPDLGTITILNPTEQPGPKNHFVTWTSRLVPYLSVFTPSGYPELSELFKLIREKLADGPVFIDLPWNYPERKKLLEQEEISALAIAVMDCDYHHWLRWEKEIEEWNGEVWLNQSDSGMSKRMRTLIREHLGDQKIREFPYFEYANTSKYLGRPIAIEPEARSFFMLSREEEYANLCEATH